MSVVKFLKSGTARGIVSRTVAKARPVMPKAILLREFTKHFKGKGKTRANVARILKMVRRKIPHVELTQKELKRIALNRRVGKILRSRIDAQILCFNDASVMEAILKKLGYTTKYVTAVSDTTTATGVLGLHAYLEFETEGRKGGEDMRYYIDFSNRSIHPGRVKEITKLARIFEGKKPQDVGVKNYADFEQLAEPGQLGNFIRRTAGFDTRLNIPEKKALFRSLSMIAKGDDTTRTMIVNELTRLIDLGVRFQPEELKIIQDAKKAVGLK